MDPAAPELEELMQCAYCKQRFNDTDQSPKLLSCKHYFCLQCTRTVLNKGSELYCIHCWKRTELGEMGPEALQTYTPILSLVKKFTGAKNAIEKPHGNKMTVISENCHIHAMPLALWCHNCTMAICRACATTIDHTNHVIKSQLEARDQLVNELHNDLESMDNMLKDTQKFYKQQKEFSLKILEACISLKQCLENELLSTINHVEFVEICEAIAKIRMNLLNADSPQAVHNLYANFSMEKHRLQMRYHDMYLQCQWDDLIKNSNMLIDTSLLIKQGGCFQNTNATNAYLTLANYCTLQLFNRTSKINDSQLGNNYNAANAANGMLNGMLNTNGMLNSTNAMINTANGMLNSNNGMLNSNNGMLNSSNGMLNSNNAMLNSNNGMLNSNNGMLNSSNGMLNSNNGMLNSNNGMLNSNNGMLNSNNAMLNSNNGMLNSSNGMLNSNNAMLNSNNAMLTANNGLLASSNGLLGSSNGMLTPANNEYYVQPPVKLYESPLRSCNSSELMVARSNPVNLCPIFYFNLEVNGAPLGRILIEVRADVAPKMAKNFAMLTTGDSGFGYKGCSVFQCWEGESVITGDFELNNGRGGRSVYEDSFFLPDDTKLLAVRGTVGMRRTQKRHDNMGMVGSQFRVILQEMRGFSGIFGHVIEGLELVEKISTYGDSTGKPTKNVIIVKCGKL